MDAEAHAGPPEPGSGRETAPAATVADEPGGSQSIEPTEDEIEAWAEQERERRRSWLQGPTEAERSAWVRRERIRRLAGLGSEARAAELARLGRRYGRETQLVAEGALSLLWSWSRRTFAQLSQAGLDWEEEANRSPRRRRVPLDHEEP
jgi:hypothetical protein